MAAAVWTLTQPTGIRGHTEGNKKVRYWNLTADTGDYTSGTPTYTAQQLGMSQKIAFVSADGVGTQNTHATAQMVGFIYNAANTSVTIYIYESGAAGAPPVEKTLEAMVTGFSVRLRVEGQ